jgi:mono/diheme cytochrome c family protein
LCAAAAHSQEAALPDAATGRALAERLCSTCHLVEGGATTSVPAGVPTLRGLANRPGQSARRIENALIQPHPPMPDMRLTASEIQHLLAYLETLRTNPQVPPLHTPPGERKPEWPKPS